MPDDNTDLNATTGAHGLLAKLGGGTINFLEPMGLGLRQRVGQVPVIASIPELTPTFPIQPP